MADSFSVKAILSAKDSGFSSTLKSAASTIDSIDKKISGFAAPDAVLTAVESRSSCPLRILRGEDGQSEIRGLFPCGEGAGYAGGIMSAAVDGMKSAESLIDSL